MPRISNQPQSSEHAGRVRECIFGKQTSTQHNQLVSKRNAQNNRCNEKFRAKFGVSRQRLWQLRQKAAGRCVLCGKKSVKKKSSKNFIGLCKRHRLSENERHREIYRRNKAAA